MKAATRNEAIATGERHTSVVTAAANGGESVSGTKIEISRADATPTLPVRITVRDISFYLPPASAAMNAKPAPPAVGSTCTTAFTAAANIVTVDSIYNDTTATF